MNYQQENEARAAAFEALMQQVAERLSALNGSQWVFAGPEEKNSVRPYGRIERLPEIEGLPPSRRLALSVQQYRDGYSASAKERIKASVSWPRDASGAYRGLRDYGLIPYNQSEPDISVSAEAPAARIAKEIQRRLIVAGEVEANYAKVLERQAHDAAYRDRKQLLAAELFELAELPKYQRDDRQDRDPIVRLYDFAPGVSYGDLRVAGDDSVRIEVSVNGAIAKQFLELLKARREVANG